MKISIKILFLFFLSTFFIKCTNNSFKSIEAPEFEHYTTDTTCILVDVRTANEYKDGHIANAINIDIKQDSFATSANRILLKNKTIAVYCRSGTRSKIAASSLSKMGFNVVELNTGYKGWIEHQKTNNQ